MSAPTTYKPLPIVKAVKAQHALTLVNEFMAGASPLAIARRNGFSRTGVEELIRAYTSKPRKGRSLRG